MNTTARSTANTETPLADAALLQLIWLASPALPVGGFSYSEGLEAAVEAALVHDEASAGEWIAAQLQASLARADLAVVGAALAAAREEDGERLQALDDWVRQTRETSELRQQSEQMGRSLGEWQKALRTPQAGVRVAHHQPTQEAAAMAGDSGRLAVSAANPSFTYPVAFGVAAAASAATARQVALAFAFGWAENMVQSAIKAVPLGQGAGQRILARLAAAIPAAVDHALSLDDETRQAFTPMLAILSSQHETQYSRLFRS